MPSLPNSLAWSADGSYLAAGIWGLTVTGEARPCKVYVVERHRSFRPDHARGKRRVEGLAFSLDGKWLAVGAARPSISDTEVPSELVVFDVPAFTVRFTAKAGSPENCGVVKDRSKLKGDPR